MIEKLNGTELWLESTGRGQALVFIHGFSLDARMWDAQLEAFKADHQLVRYDLRGFGRSALPNEAYRHSEDLLAILNYLQLQKVTLIGLSLGGGVALDVALTYPDRLEALVLADSIIDGFGFSEKWRSTNKAIWTAGKTDIELAKSLWLNHELFESVNQSSAAQEFKQILADYSGWHWQNKDPQLYTKPAAVERLEDIKLPTLILIGEKDISDFQQIAEVLSTLPKAQKVVIPEAGHMTNMENPQTFNQKIRDFLRDLL
ncbi:MAG: alpha/beta fold hydrolase [Trueperaceae bacterium]|nr:alpha/beta fold hydrolase [Trueperaceae bacterium]